MAKALQRFHAQFPDVALSINVTRHPYSFLGDSKDGGFLRSGGTWHEVRTPIRPPIHLYIHLKLHNYPRISRSYATRWSDRVCIYDTHTHMSFAGSDGLH